VGERFYLQQKEGARNMSKAYTEKQVALMILAYENGNTDAERKTIMEGLAIELGKTVGSIRAKLVAVGHYIKLTPKTIENKFLYRQIRVNIICSHQIFGRSFFFV
jgi:tRNA U34 2-thiouridine synthase MnmA/TrmU